MINLERIQQLLTEDTRPTLSIYLDVDEAKPENQAAQPAWKIFLKDAIHEAEVKVTKSEGWRKLKQRLDDYFDGYSPQAKGLVVFFTSEDEQAYELPVPVNSRWLYGKPLIAPLLWAIDAYEPYLIVRVDREKAEVLTAHLGDTVYEFEEAILEAPLPVIEGARGLTQGSARESVQNMINEHIAQFHRQVVDHLETQVKKQPHIRIMISGEEQSAHAVRNLLPERLAGSVIEVKPLPMYLSERQVFDHLLPDALAYERAQELNRVQQVIDFAKAGGRGALGRKDVELALQMRRVETLLLPWPTTDEVEANELSERAFASGGKVEWVRGAAADRLNQEGGIAARLYYTIEPS